MARVRVRVRVRAPVGSEALLSGGRPGVEDKADQQAVLAKVKSLTRSHIVYPGVKHIKGQALSKADVPGLAETAWNPDLDAL